eukprot:2934049-Pleurochrysis_carterae.AAC.1
MANSGRRHGGSNGGLVGCQWPGEQRRGSRAWRGQAVRLASKIELKLVTADITSRNARQVQAQRQTTANAQAPTHSLRTERRGRKHAQASPPSPA